jgi:hypothetical protein
MAPVIPLKPKEFQKLRRLWRKNLEESGFSDCEDQKGRLKRPDNRTIGFQNRERIRNFFMALDHYLTDHPDLPRRERYVLSLYSEGWPLIEIAHAAEIGLTQTKAIFRKYKPIILEYLAKVQEDDEL